MGPDTSVYPYTSVYLRLRIAPFSSVYLRLRIAPYTTVYAGTCEGPAELADIWLGPVSSTDLPQFAARVEDL